MILLHISILGETAWLLFAKGLLRLLTSTAVSSDLFPLAIKVFLVDATDISVCHQLKGSFLTHTSFITLIAFCFTLMYNSKCAIEKEAVWNLSSGNSLRCLFFNIFSIMHFIL